MSSSFWLTLLNLYSVEKGIFSKKFLLYFRLKHVELEIGILKSHYK